MPNALNNSQRIKQLAQQVGFTFCGISKSAFLEEEAPRLENWLNNGYHGKMKYMENHFDMRLDPSKLVPGAKTVVSLMYNYFPKNELKDNNLKIAKYAYGEDYHTVVKDKCKELIYLIEENIGKIEGRAFTDSAPIMERAWAAKSGIGWIGKHGLAINKQQGSFFFLAELIIDLECSPDNATKDYCGTCTACIDACPTEAILPNKTLNASQCISYLTIELKEEIPGEFKDKMNNWIFGCDICQDVCPWNRFSKAHNEQKFNIKSEIDHFSQKDWQEITESVFGNLFSKSAIKRTKFEGLKRNIDFIDNRD
ncbi:MAG: tRNA epoxyqueuosine(34) reductase QueG [Bacteroidetes bacterium]|nr:tRNA epoxyqueuosine(34) reductase QueG [Bacteroidota bacterium]